MMSNDRPSLAIGQPVKLYRPPIYGREIARVTEIDNTTGVLSVRLDSGEIISGVVYKRDFVEPKPYWVELPDGWSGDQ